MRIGVRGPKAVSLSYELAEVADAMSGAVAILDPLNEPPGYGPAPGRVTALVSGISVLELVIARLRLLKKAVDRTLDPAMILTPANEISLREIRPPEDVALIPFSEREQIQRARAELARLERHQQRKQRKASR